MKENGYIGCKKHGLLTNGQLYNSEYDFQYRKPYLNKDDLIKQIKQNGEK